MISEDKVYKIEFTKKDGSLRLLTGTRDLSRIPKELHPKGSHLVNESVVTIFDLDLKEWRSFRKESLNSIEELKDYA